MFVIFGIITNKNFRTLLSGSLIYALNVYDEIRGGGSSDVFLFDHEYCDKVFGPKKT